MKITDNNSFLEHKTTESHPIRFLIKKHLNGKSIKKRKTKLAFIILQALEE